MTDDEFIEKFENGEIPKSNWTHREHVKMAYIYLIRYSLDESIDKIREGIKKLNRAHDVEESQFHETITIGWVKIISSSIDRTKAVRNSEDFCIDNPQLLVWKSLFDYYSEDRIKSSEARQGFLEPDLKSFPSPKSS